MTIALAAIPDSGFWMEAAILAVVAVGITAAVYGAVALIVKADDVGCWLARNGRLGVTRKLGRGIVEAMPSFLKLLMVIGTAAMLWVGGSIILHSAAEMGWPAPYNWVHHVAEDVALWFDQAREAIEWIVTAAIDGVFGLALGLMLIPVGTRLITPVWKRLKRLNPLV